MNVNNQTITFQVEMPNGQVLKVNYQPRFSFSPELNHRVDHFEFYGALSETGYYSHFVFVEPSFKETDESILECARKFIEEESGMKYGQPAQQALM